MRLFIALDLPEEVCAQARGLCQGLATARWTNPAQLHLTLRFLGDVTEEEVPALQTNLERVAVPAFTLGLRGVGVFPRKRRPARVLWTGVAPAEPVAALKAAIDAVLGPDPEADERGFSPHLTLARFREDPRAALDGYLAQHAGFASASWMADRFYLYRSTLGSDGARHEILQRYPLRAP
jgi:2'-5' RNA ligase